MTATAPYLPALILTGPTAIGKTEIAVRLAKRHPFELISADSMQVYRGMEIGTAQPKAEELQGVELHGCGLIDPREPFSVKQFIDLSEIIHAQIKVRGGVPLYVGGTGMYLRALRWGLFDEPQRDAADSKRTRAEIRARLNAEADQIGAEALHLRLSRIDPALAGKISPRDAIRVVRALEVAELTGMRLSDLQKEWPAAQPRFKHNLLILTCPRPVLVSRIERRVEGMLAAGWVEEVADLLRRGYPPALHCFKALGYREILAHLEGKISESEMISRIKAKIRQFSKRQMTWFRKERDAHWIEFDGEDIEQALPSIEKIACA